jgi:hypothetical protein
MSMVGGVFSQPTIITGTVPLVFGAGRREMRVRTNLLVVDVEALPYDIILGTPVLKALGAEIDFKSECMKVFPRWSKYHDPTVWLNVPLSITVKSESSGLPISAPIVAASQTLQATDSSAAMPVLCCATQARLDC